MVPQMQWFNLPITSDGDTLLVDIQMPKKDFVINYGLTTGGTAAMQKESSPSTQLINPQFQFLLLVPKVIIYRSLFY